MADITIPGYSQLHVSWGCRRCGFTGGIAKTCIPVDNQWNEEMVRALFDALRDKLVKKHQAHMLQSGKTCIPLRDDFRLDRYVPAPCEPKVMGVV